MARFEQLEELIGKVRIDLGEDPDASRGRFTDDMVKRELNRAQNVLWLSYEWPFRYREWAIPLVKGERFYRLPEQVDMEGIQDMRVKWGSAYLPVMFAYSNDLWTARDPNTDQTSSPISMWRLHEPISGREKANIEVWPVPSQDGQVYTDPTFAPPVSEKDAETDSVAMDGDNFLLLRAARRLPEMQDRYDKSYLDGEVLVGFAVAAIAARRQLPDAGNRLSYANELLKRVRAAGTEQRSISLSRGRMKRGSRFNSSNQWGNRYAR